MKHYLRFVVSGAVVMLVAGAVSAVILDPGVNPADKGPQKHRADVNKQVAKYIDCATKALVACEKKGTSSAPECDIQNPISSTIADAAAKQKFIDSLLKCATKLDFIKKGPASDYSLVGCPGDVDTVTPGDQPYPNYSAMQLGIPAAVADAVLVVTPVLQVFCGGAPPTSDATVLDCQTKGAQALAKYVKGAGKCQWKCENDYKNKKGNGGPTDSTTQCSIGDSADTNFNGCVAKAKATAEKKIPVGDLTLVEFQLLEDSVSDSLNDTNNDGYNENDCP